MSAPSHSFQLVDGTCGKLTGCTFPSIRLCRIERSPTTDAASIRARHGPAHFPRRLAAAKIGAPPFLPFKAPPIVWQNCSVQDTREVGGFQLVPCMHQARYRVHGERFAGLERVTFARSPAETRLALSDWLLVSLVAGSPSSVTDGDRAGGWTRKPDAVGAGSPGHARRCAGLWSSHGV